MELNRNISSHFGERELPSLASPVGWGTADSADLTCFGDVFRIEDLSEFSNEDIAGPIPSSDATLSSASSQTLPKHGIWTSFTTDDFAICPPVYEGMSLDWLSEFMEDSFRGSSDLGSFADSSNITDEKPTVEAAGDMDQNLLSKKERMVPRRARSKRPRAGRCRGWSYEDYGYGPQVQIVKARKVEQVQQQPRRCTHCLSQRTPQWRAGPLGPKTLCNACGVRFKSGRLFPEYRPAKSPTFVNAVHSNSHKKVLEMRSESESNVDVQTSHALQLQQQQPPFKVKIKISPSASATASASAGNNSPTSPTANLEDFSCGSN